MNLSGLSKLPLIGTKSTKTNKVSRNLKFKSRIADVRSDLEVKQPPESE